MVVARALLTVCAALAACGGAEEVRPRPTGAPAAGPWTVELPAVSMGALSVTATAKLSQGQREERLQALLDARNDAVRQCFRSAPPPVPAEAAVVIQATPAGVVSTKVSEGAASIAPCLARAYAVVAVPADLAPFTARRTLRWTRVEGAPLLDVTEPLTIQPSASGETRPAPIGPPAAAPDAFAHAPEPLRADEVRAAVDAQRASLQQCYDGILRRAPGAKGTLTLTFTINWDGSAAEGGVVSEGKPPAVFVRDATCIAGALDSLRFRAAGVNTPVRLRVVFEPR
jgi:hypothetical protein